MNQDYLSQIREQYLSKHELPLYDPLDADDISVEQSQFHRTSTLDLYQRGLPSYVAQQDVRLRNLSEGKQQSYLGRKTAENMFGGNADFAFQRIDEKDFEELFAPSGLKWENGVTWGQALVMQEAKGFERALDEGFHVSGSGWRMVGDLFMQMPHELLDPTNVLSAMAVPESWIARKALRGAGAVRKIARSGIAGAVGNAAVEPAIYLGNQYKQSEYGILDSAFSVSGGFLLGAGLRGIPYAFRGAQEGAGRVALRASQSLSQLAEGQDPSAGPVIGRVTGPGTKMAKGIAMLEKFGSDSIYKAKLFKIKELLTDQADSEKIRAIIDDDAFLDSLINTLSDLDDSIRSIHSQYKDVFADPEQLVQFIKDNKNTLHERFLRIAEAVEAGEIDEGVDLFGPLEVNGLTASLYQIYKSMDLMVEVETVINGETKTVKVPSLLSPDAYRAVRTEEFKKQFGNWEDPDAEVEIEFSEATNEPIAVFIDGERTEISDLFGDGDEANKLNQQAKNEIKAEIREYARTIERDKYMEYIERAKKLQQAAARRAKIDKEFTLEKWLRGESADEENVKQITQHLDETEVRLEGNKKIRRKTPPKATEEGPKPKPKPKEEAAPSTKKMPAKSLGEALNLDEAPDLLLSVLYDLAADNAQLRQSLLDLQVGVLTDSDKVGDIFSSGENPINLGTLKESLPVILDSIRKAYKTDPKIRAYFKANKKNMATIIKQLKMFDEYIQSMDEGLLSETTLGFFDRPQPEGDVLGEYHTSENHVSMYSPQVKTPQGMLNTLVHEIGHALSAHYFGVFIDLTGKGPLRSFLIEGASMSEFFPEVQTPDWKKVTVHSGAASGADTEFQLAAVEAGAEVKAHSFSGHNISPRLRNQQDKLVVHTEEELKEAEKAVERVAEDLERNIPSHNNYVWSLLRRNYFQVRDSEQVIAVAPFERTDDDVIGFDQVGGGTAWAVQMGIHMRKEVYLFDQKTNRWMQYKYGRSEWDRTGEGWTVIDGPPQLKEKFAGIGSRNLTPAGKAAIRSLFAESKKAADTPQQRLLDFFTELASKDAPDWGSPYMQALMLSFDPDLIANTFNLDLPKNLTAQEFWDPNGKYADIVAPLRDVAVLYVDFINGIKENLFDELPSNDIKYLFLDSDIAINQAPEFDAEWNQLVQDYQEGTISREEVNEVINARNLRYYLSNLDEFFAQGLLEPSMVEAMSQVTYANPSQVFHGKWARDFEQGKEPPSAFKAFVTSIAEVFSKVTGKTKPEDKVTMAEALAYTQREMAAVHYQNKLKSAFAEFEVKRSRAQPEKEEEPSDSDFGIPDLPELQWVDNQLDPLNRIKRGLVLEANSVIEKISNAKKRYRANGMTKDEFVDLIYKYLNYRRRKLMDIEVYENFEEFSSAFSNKAEALKAYINGTLDVAGLDQRILGLQREIGGELMQDLKAEGLDEVFLSDKYAEDIYHATAILDGITEGVDQSAIPEDAFRIAEILKRLKDRQVALVNMMGGDAQVAKNHARVRRHSPERILRGTSKKKWHQRHDHDTAVEQWVDFVLNNNLNFELTFGFIRNTKGHYLFSPHKGIGKAIVDKIAKDPSIETRQEAIDMAAPLLVARDEAKAMEMFRDHLTEICESILDTNRNLNKKNDILMSSHDEMGLQRKLVFRSWKDNYNYDNQYSGRSFAEGVMLDVRNKARGLAMMEFFGSNEGQMFNEIEGAFSEEIREGLKNSKNPLERSGVITTRSYFEKITGEADNPENHNLNRIAAIIRSVLIMGQLEKAIVSSISDLANLDSTMRANGIEKVTRIREDFDKFVNDDAGKDLLMQVGVGAEQWLGEAAMRFGYNEHAPGMASNAMRFFFKAIGMNAWNKFNQSRAVSMLSTNLGMNSRLSFDSLDSRLRGSLEKYGIDSDDWDVLRSAVTESKGGVGSLTLSEQARFITLDAADRGTLKLRAAAAAKNNMNLATYSRKLKQKLMTYYSDQMDSAVLQPGNWEMTNLHLGSKAGTRSGEMIRLMSLYKAFGLAVLNKVGAREIAFTMGGGGLLSLGAYAGQAMICGYISQTISDILNNREPNLPYEGEAIMDSIRKSGALGIFGDLVLGETYAQDASIDQKVVNNFTSYLAGPVGGIADRLFEASKEITMSGQTYFDADTGRNAKRSASKGGRMLFQTMVDNIPFLDYPLVGLALDTIVWDNISDAIDKGYEERRERGLNLAGSGTIFDVEF